MITRRQMLKLGLAGGGAPLLRVGGAFTQVSSGSFDEPSPPTTPFVRPLPIPPTTQPVGPFAAPDCPSDIVNDSTTRFYLVVEEEAMVSLHPELPNTRVWRYRDVNTSATSSIAVGPTFKVRQNRAGIVRFANNLPDPSFGFGVNRTTVHLHGGHAPARSDGFPADIPEFDVGESRDYCYPHRDPGFSTGEVELDLNGVPLDRPSTNWYHDHLLDFTGPNVYRGLAGFYVHSDEIDTGDENHPPPALKLPSGAFDIPLLIQDRRIAGDGSLIYLPGEHDGFLGDKWLVNGAIQPFLRVKRRKYRFRLLNGANARQFMFFLTDRAGNNKPFIHIATGGGLMDSPISVDRVALYNAQRDEIVVDFSRFPTGTELFLEDRFDQEDGRGPEGKFNDPKLLSKGRKFIKFIVENAVPDASRMPARLRPFDPVPKAVLARANRREFVFERRRGAWAINGKFIDVNDPIVSPPINTPEIWRLVNKSGGWWHPIHVHQDFMRILTRNGKRPPLDERDGQSRTDTVMLGPNDEVEVYLNFRDFPGPFVFHCHNLEHEDMFMMARYDVVG